ncbi:MAG: FG-GAP repeat domain-containing protein, partial [Planctomycetota bacterium]
AIRTNGLALVDFDADGDLDLYLANDVRLGNSDRLYENDGAGNFTTVASFGNVNDTLDVRAADFDQDGDTDLLLVDAPPGQRRLRYLENTGNGLVASAAVPPSATPFESLTLGDWNADGLLDYAVLAGCTVRAFVGDAPGSFQPALQAAVPLSNCATVGMRLFALDLEQDGDSDLIVNSASPAATQQSPDSLLLRNLGDRFEVAAGASPASIRNSIVRTGDFNNDGIEDMVVSPTFGESGQLWLGTGTDSFLAGPTSTFGSPGAIPGDMRVADVTGDGLPDVICVNNPDYFQTSLPSRIYRSTGSSLQTVGAVLPFARKLAAADFDGDGDVDLLLDTATIPDMLLANTGSGIFTAVANAIPPTSFFPNTYPTDLFAADFDGDGDLDVAGIGSQLLQNNGSGIFSMVSSGPISYPLVADFDADGDPDVFLPLLGVLPGNHTMLRNDGNWSFASVSIPATQRVPAIHHVAADFDNDGLMDLVGTTFRGSAYGYPPSTILHNLGGMAFAAVPDSVLAEPSAVADSVARLDIDGDDDVDVIVPDGRGLLVYRNLHHQLAWRSLPRVGGRVALDIYGRAGEAFVLGIAPRLAPVPIPLPGLGTLHLDPATLQASAARSIGPEGRFGYVVDLPNAPQLVGVVVFAQALYPQQIGNLETIELRAR